MNTTSRTMVFAAVACVSALAAVSAWFGSRPAAVEGYADVGQEFFAEFTDPLKATSLSVSEFNDQTKAAKVFSVRQNDDGLWVIPSHHDYPAEARERLARTAASLIGVKKTAVQSRSKDDWKLYAVVDPGAEGAASKEERGTRVSLKDASGNPLVDLIVGRKVDGREDHYYVREPEKNTTYIAQMKPYLSAKFSDWIEPDLLKVTSTDIVSVTVDNYSIDEDRGAVLEGEKLEFAKENLASTGKWQLKGLNDDEEKLNETPVRDVATNLDTLKIVGVRPKPEGLNADLTVSPEVARNPLLRQVLQADMQRQGFYAASGKDGGVRLVSNDGELLAGTSKGVMYTLYFGEIVRGSEEDIEIGFADKDSDQPGEAADGEDKSDPDTDKANNNADEPESGPRRYLLVKVDFDETLLGPAPTAPSMPVKPDILNQPADADSDPATQQPTEDKPADEAKPEAKESEGTSSDEGSDVPASEDGSDDASCVVQDETPAADEPKADEPNADEPKADEPKADEPKADEPKADEPKADEPKADEPKADEPKADEPKADEPKADEPKADEPKADEPKADEPKADEPKADEPKADDPKADDPKADEAAPAAPPVDPRQAAQAEYDRQMAEYESQKAAYDRDVKSREEKIEEGKKAAEELSARFSSWYYVISSDSFEKFRLKRADVVGPKTEEASEPQP